MIRPDGTLDAVPRVLVVALVTLGFAISSVQLVTFVTYACYALVGALLAVRRPRNGVSWLLLFLAFAFIGTTSTPGVDMVAIVDGRASMLEVLWTALFSWSGYGVFLGFGALGFLFPAGRLSDGRWRRIAVTALIVGVAVTAASMLTPTLEVSLDGSTSVEVPNPLAVAPDLTIWPIMPAIALATAIAVFALGVLCLMDRYRTAGDPTRVQIRWLLAAIASVLIGVVLGISLFLLGGDELGVLIWIPAIATYPTVPLAIGVAITRYRLYEIDRIVNRAVVYGGVTAILAGAFAALTAVSQRLFLAMTGQTSDAAIVLTTLAVATLYSPVRKRVEAAAERVFKYDQRRFGAYRDQLQRLLDLVEPASAAGRLAREVLIETRAVGVAVADGDGDLLGTAGTWPVDGATLVEVGPGSPIGTILVGPRADGRPHEPETLAAAAAIAVMAGRAIDASRVGRPVSPVPAIDPAHAVAPRPEQDQLLITSTEH
jgi:hypothetical protein